MKHTNIFITGVPTGEEREKGSERTLEDIMAENFTNLINYTILHIQDAE